MNTAVTKGAGSMDIKKVSISAKRQITIPQKFFTLLGFDDEAECVVRGNELVIRAVRNNSSGEYAELILDDLIAEGLNGEKKKKKFKETQKKVRPAIEEMLEDASKAAMSEGGFETYSDVFGSEG